MFGLSEEFFVPKVSFLFHSAVCSHWHNPRLLKKKLWMQTLVSRCFETLSWLSDVQINFLMSVHYLCKYSALAKLLCLQLLPCQCQFPKKVVEKRKYVTLYAESCGKQLQAVLCLQCRNLGDCGTKELLSLFLFYFRLLHSLFFICALPFVKDMTNSASLSWL